MISKTLGHHQMTEELAECCMGEFYRAEGTTLHRFSRQLEPGLSYVARTFQSRSRGTGRSKSANFCEEAQVDFWKSL